MVDTRKIMLKGGEVNRKRWGEYLFLAVLVGVLTSATGWAGNGIELRKATSDDSVDVRINGELFTSYRYGDEFSRKPVFYPVMAPNGVVVNRELQQVKPEVAEEQDHPHHESLFLGYGDVDSYDFWSNRNGEKIEHRAVLNLEGGDEEGILELLLAWNDPQGRTMVWERRCVTFGTSGDCNWMDHDIVLDPGRKSRLFMDTKEGMFAIRLADELREKDGTGRYINAWGWETAREIWGTRCPWVAIRGTIGDMDVTVAIFDHPSSQEYPSYWHARDYGLFSINPFGRKDFVKDAAPLARKLNPGESFRFRYRVMVYSGKVSKDRLDQDYWDYIK